MLDLELKLPTEVLDNIPSSKEDMVLYLAKYFDGVISKYDVTFQKRVHGVMGGPLSRYEKSLLKDFLIAMTIGNIEQEQASQLAAESITR